MGTTIINNFLTPKNVSNAFTFKIDTALTGSPSNQYTLPLASNTNYNFTVDWGDGTTELVNVFTTTNLLVTKTYGVAGIYTISINGVFPRIFVNNSTSRDRQKIIEVSNWGDVGWLDFNSSFTGCFNLKIVALDGVRIQNVAFFGNAFRSTSLIDFPPNQFDTWNATPLNECFRNTWADCNLSANSVENILVSIATSGSAAPGTTISHREITIVYNAASGGLTPATNAAIATLKSRLWVPRINGVNV